jgi:hypothetical protein
MTGITLRRRSSIHRPALHELLNVADQLRFRIRLAKHDVNPGGGGFGTQLVIVGGHHDDRHLRGTRIGTHLTRELHAVHAGHVHIGDQQVGRRMLDLSRCIEPIFGRHHLVAMARQQPGGLDPHDLRIISHHHDGFFLGFLSGNKRWRRNGARPTRGFIGGLTLAFLLDRSLDRQPFFVFLAQGFLYRQASGFAASGFVGGLTGDFAAGCFLRSPMLGLPTSSFLGGQALGLATGNFLGGLTCGFIGSPPLGLATSRFLTSRFLGSQALGLATGSFLRGLTCGFIGSPPLGLSTGRFLTSASSASSGFGFLTSRFLTSRFLGGQALGLATGSFLRGLTCGFIGSPPLGFLTSRFLTSSGLGGQALGFLTSSGLGGQALGRFSCGLLCHPALGFPTGSGIGRLASSLFGQTFVSLLNESPGSGTTSPEYPQQKNGNDHTDHDQQQTRVH